jgi:hypothetical protein
VKAEYTRAGGRYAARERGANDLEEPESPPAEEMPKARSVPLGERLSDSSIRILAGTLQKLGLKLDQEAHV